MKTPTITFKRNTELNTKMIEDLLEIMKIQENTDKITNDNVEYGGWYGTYKIKADNDGNITIMGVESHG